MAKLSSIFNNINNYETEKQKYFAEKLISSYMVDNGLLTESQSSQFVEDKIIAEAIKYGSLDKALEFVDGIVKQSTQLDEAWDIGGALKKAGTWVKDKAVAIKDAIVNWFKGATVTALKKFHTDISDDYAALKEGDADEDEDEDEETPTIEGGEEQKQLTASLKTDHSLDYLMEEEGEEATTDDGAGFDDTTEEEDDSNLNAKMVKIVALLASKKKIDTPKKTGSSQKRFRFFKITKAGVNVTLHVGQDEGSMKVLLTYMGASSKVFLNLSTDVVGTQLEMKVVYQLLEAMMANDIFKLGEYVNGITQAGKKITLNTKSATLKALPGRMMIIPVGGKVGQPIKVKKSKTPEEFAAVFAKIDTDEANSETGGEGSDSTKPRIENFKTDEEFQTALTAWGDSHDEKDFGGAEKDLNNNEVKAALEKELLTYFGLTTAEELQDSEKAFNALSTKITKKEIGIDNINQMNDTMSDYLDYLKASNKLNGATLPTINKGLDRLLNDHEQYMFKKEDITPELKTRIMKLSNEFVSLVNSYNGITVAFDEKRWEILDGIEASEGVSDKFNRETKEAEPAAIEEQLKKAHTIIYNGSGAVENATSFFGQDETSNLKFTLEQAKTFVIKLEAAVKTPENQKLLFEKFKGLTGKAMFDAVVMFINEVPAGDITPPPKVKKVDITNPAQWIDAVVKGSGAMNVDTFFLEKMKVDNKLLWKNFKSFATENQNSLAEIMFSIDDAEHHGKMSPNEFVLFATRVPTILKYVESQVKKDLLDPQDFSKEAFSEFITDIIPAANTMSTTISNSLGRKSKKNVQGDSVITSTTPAPAPSDTGPIASEIVAPHNPKAASLISTMDPKVQQKLLKVVQHEDIIKSKSFDSILSKTDFLENDTNIENKIKMVSEMIALKFSTEDQLKVIEAIINQDIESNFQEISPFTTPKETLEFINNGGNFDDKALEIFNKSKF